MSMEEERDAILHAERAVNEAFAEASTRTSRSDDRWFWALCLTIVCLYAAVISLALTGVL